MSDAALNLDQSVIGTPAYMDLQLGPSGDLQSATGVSAIIQSVTLRLNAYTQDYFLAMDDGLDYYGQVLTGRQGLTPAFEAEIQNCILDTPGIIGLISWSSSFDSAKRNLSFRFEAQCSGGTVAFSVPVGISEQ